MTDVNWWLMTLAFVLGVVLTFASTTRRVTREVPAGVAAIPAAEESAVAKDSGEEQEA